MDKFRQVTPDLSVAPQLSESDLQAAKDMGFRTILCNRPDGEEENQPPIETLKAHAEALGLAFLALPFAGPPSPETIGQQGALIEHAAKPVLAYCRSGTRSVTAWALSQRGQGKGPQIIAAASDAGYDLSALAAVL